MELSAKMAVSPQKTPILLILAVVITIGTGVGGGIIVNSQLLLGAREIGHITIQSEGENCTCGNRGCYEHYASTAALVRMAKTRIQSGKLDWKEGESVNGKTIFQHMKKQPELEKLITTWISYVASGIVSLITIFNPEKVIIGGGICREQDAFILPLKKRCLNVSGLFLLKDLKLYRHNLETKPIF